jgi:hypothetical protein
VSYCKNPHEKPGFEPKSCPFLACRNSFSIFLPKFCSLFQAAGQADTQRQEQTAHGQEQLETLLKTVGDPLKLPTGTLLTKIGDLPKNTTVGDPPKNTAALFCSWGQQL